MQECSERNATILNLSSTLRPKSRPRESEDARFCPICRKTLAVGDFSGRYCRPCSTRTTFNVICPVCAKVKQLSRSALRRYTKAPWACRACVRKKKWRELRPQLVKCKCDTWFKPHKRTRDASTCQLCLSGRELEPTKECPVCKTEYSSGRAACSDACANRLRKNDDYFGGRMQEADGWDEKRCQACHRIRPSGYQIHHVYGHPDHSRLVLLCPGCHEIVSKLAWRKLDIDVLRKLVEFAIMQFTKRDVLLSIREVE